MPPPGAASVEALIVSFNTRDALRNTLDSLLEHGPPPSVGQLRVSVFDNASSDGSAEMVERQYPGIRLVRSERNVGFGQANNRLAFDSSSDYLLLLNSDVIVTSDAITPMLARLNSDRRLIAVGPRLVYPSGQVQYSAHRLPTLSYEFARILQGRRLGRTLRPIFDSQRKVAEIHEVALTDARAEPRTAEFLWATCWLVRRDQVFAHGLFDKAFPVYDEDLDFCKRLQQRGRTFGYLPSVEMVHLGGISSALQSDKQQRMVRARRMYYRRHHGLVAWCVYAWLVPFVGSLADLLECVPRPRLRTLLSR